MCRHMGNVKELQPTITNILDMLFIPKIQCANGYKKDTVFFWNIHKNINHYYPKACISKDCSTIMRRAANSLQISKWKIMQMH